uniref:Uncharacterized protein n=1 Tax=Spongospora subterranea TaxID=70186 RepID=A0A0H5RIV7_9EUKA|eukprot:CRZ08629.1 hypothetical protein [Spongospora subterranea]
MAVRRSPSVENAHTAMLRSFLESQERRDRELAEARLEFAKQLSALRREVFQLNDARRSIESDSHPPIKTDPSCVVALSAGGLRHTVSLADWSPVDNFSDSNSDPDIWIPDVSLRMIFRPPSTLWLATRICSLCKISHSYHHCLLSFRIACALA